MTVSAVDQVFNWLRFERKKPKKVRGIFEAPRGCTALEILQIRPIVQNHYAKMTAEQSMYDLNQANQMRSRSPLSLSASRSMPGFQDMEGPCSSKAQSNRDG